MSARNTEKFSGEEAILTPKNSRATSRALMM